MRILLVHGLGRTRLSMALLARRLRRVGHETDNFGYVAFREPYADICTRLTTRIRLAETRGRPWVAIGHSLGGLLLRDTIAHAGAGHLHHLILLATPNQPPRLAPRALRVPPFRWYTGECGRQLASPGYFSALPVPTVPYTIIAGTRGITGRWSPFGDEPNDGIVAVQETVLDPMTPPHTLRAAHTFIMNNTTVQALILDILAGTG